jgi:hypothetical protein
MSKTPDPAKSLPAVPDRERFMLDLIDVRAAAGQIRLMSEVVRNSLSAAGVPTKDAWLLNLRALDVEKMLVDLHIRAEQLLTIPAKESGGAHTAPEGAKLH